MSEELSEKEKEWLKKVFMGEVLNGWIERARVKPLSEFMGEEKGSTLIKSLMAEKDGETLIIGLLRDGEHVKFAVLCGKAPGEVEHLCHVREVRDGELYDKVKRILQALGYRVKEVVLDLEARVEALEKELEELKEVLKR